MKEKIKESDKMYVVVNNQLAPSYKMVQGAHALAAFALEQPKRFKEWNNQYLIFVAVPTLKDLDSLVYEVGIKDEDHDYFIEEDLNNMLTALAYYNPYKPVPLWLQELPLA